MKLQIIHNKIYEIRGHKVMLDFDLAQLYEIETKHLKQAVRRNINRFPADFMFELTEQEWNSVLRSQIVTLEQERTDSKKGKHTKYLPFAFSEQGVAMLASVLNSPKAIAINISIVRAFIALRQYALDYSELNKKLEGFMLDTNIQFSEVYEALTALAEQKKIEEKPRNPIGYKQRNN